MQLTELRAALAAGMIVTLYQPIVRLADRVPTGLEALARLVHPQYGTLMPDDFVPQIEAAGLAPQLTDAVAARTFADLASPALAPLGLEVSVNFPLDVLLVPDALLRLEAQRAAKGIAANRVVIELTESRPVADTVALGHALTRLRDAGYGVMIDDVGPAVPQLAELIDLPFTGLKFDKDVVQQIAGAPATREFAARIIEAARQRGLTVVAEGVEDLATWRLMQTMGAELAQGFLVARPLPPDAVPTWLADWSRHADFT
jgi:EAL domain-containing protein (putative c-di-GMP-specific phosphodiesterase class I)